MSLDQEVINLRMWESLKKRAISSWDGFNYKKACDVLCLTPEFEDLYEQGAAEESYLKSLKIEKKDNFTKYSGFYNAGIILNEKDLRLDIDEKKRLLLKYFPGRFGNRGKEPIADMEDAKAGRLFQHMIDYAKKRTN
jgi:hypothetical protein